MTQKHQPISLFSTCFLLVIWLVSNPLLAQQKISQSSIVLSGGNLDQAIQKQGQRGYHSGSANERFTIQLMSGTRKEASALYQQLLSELNPSTELLMHFDEPHFKVYVSCHSLRLAAEYQLAHWRLTYPQAFVVEAPPLPFPTRGRN